ncbi:MAG: radical SAM protein, partial [Holosporales bacterium]
PLLMPFLHLPVQSGSDKILKDMNRKHTAQFYKDLIQKFRNVNPDLAFSSDFIVGFPGETDQDFQETLDLIQEITFSQAYSFKYSPRPGTPAAGRLDQISDTVKRQRLDVLQTLLNQQQLAFNQGTVGKVCEILIDRRGSKPGQWIGRSPYMQSVHVVDPSLSIGKMVAVEIEEGLANSLRGRLL